MDTQRWIVFAIFAMSAVMLWEAWQRQFHPPVTPPPISSSTKAQGADTPTPTAVPSQAGATPPSASVEAPAGQRLTIRTDLYTATVNTAGGVIEDVALAKHADIEDTSKPYHALIHTPDRVLVAQSGLLGGPLPNHRTVYEALPGPRELASGQNELQLKLEAKASNGDRVVQTLTFHRGSYVIDVAYDVVNAGPAPIQPFAYFQFTRDTKHQGSQSSMAPAAYVGPAIYNENDKFKKVEFSDIDKLAADPTRKPPFTKDADNGWVGMVEHYFVAAWLPNQDGKVKREFYTRKLDNGLYAAGVIVPLGTIAPGATGKVKVPLYVGPQEQDVLSQLAKGLDLVVDYGIFTVIAAPLFWLLKWLNSVIHNWGWSIIALTIIIKSAFYPLNHASARSMAKMKVIAPKMKALQEQ